MGVYYVMNATTSCSTFLLYRYVLHYHHAMYTVITGILTLSLAIIQCPLKCIIITLWKAHQQQAVFSSPKLGKKGGTRAQHGGVKALHRPAAAAMGYTYFNDRHR